MSSALLILISAVRVFFQLGDRCDLVVDGLIRFVQRLYETADVLGGHRRQRSCNATVTSPRCGTMYFAFNERVVYVPEWLSISI